MIRIALTLFSLGLNLALLEAAPFVTQFTTTNNSNQIVVAADTNNNAVAVLQDGGVIKASSLTNGGPWSALTTLSTSTDNFYPAVAMDATGTAIAMWGALGFSPSQIRTAYFTGGVWTTPTPQPLDTSATGSYFTSVAMDGLGKGLGVWSNGVNIRASFFSAGTWNTVTSLGVSSPGGGVNAAYSPSGKASAVWYHTDIGITEILANTWNGSVWSGAVNLDTTATGSPDSGIDAAGNTIAVWPSGSGVNNIVSRRFNGTSWDAVQTISAASGNDRRPKIAVDSTGKAIAIWKDSGNNLKMVKFDGSTWGAPVTIASGLTSNASYTEPMITMNTNGDALIGWLTATGSVTNAFLPKGGVLQPPVIITTTPLQVLEFDLALSLRYGFDVWNQGLEVTNTFGSSNRFIFPADLDGDCYTTKSATGELLTAESNLISQLKFSYNMNTYMADVNTTGSATVNYNSGLAEMQTTGSGTATIAGKIRAYAQPGQGVACVFAASFLNGANGTSEIAGIGNDTDGFFFEWINGTFGILHRNNSVDTFIPQSSWNVDKMNGTGPSGMILDYTLGNVYRIQYMRLEFGNINFYIESPEIGQFTLVHQIQYTNNKTLPSLTNPGLQLFAQVSSTGGITELQISSMGLYVEGNADPFLGIRNNVGTSALFNTASPVAFLFIQNDSNFSSKTNRLMVIPDELSLLNASEGDTNAFFTIYLNPVVGGSPTFTQVNPNSCVSFSTDNINLLGGTFIGNFNLSTGSSIALNIGDYGIQLSPGDTLAIACFIMGDSATTYASISWLEQF